MIAKYYSLDECSDVSVVYEKLENLQSEGKISWSSPEQDVLRIKDTGLVPKEVKDLILFFEKNDVIEYNGYEDMYEENFEDEDEDMYDDEEYDEYDDDF